MNNKYIGIPVSYTHLQLAYAYRGKSPLVAQGIHSMVQRVQPCPCLLYTSPLDLGRVSI